MATASVEQQQPYNIEKIQMQTLFPPSSVEMDLSSLVSLSRTYLQIDTSNHQNSIKTGETVEPPSLQATHDSTTTTTSPAAEGDVVHDEYDHHHDDNDDDGEEGQMLDRLEEYRLYKNHSYEDFPFDFSEDRLLDRWVLQQRDAFTNQRLSEDRIRKFQDAGLALDKKDAKWLHRWERLKSYLDGGEEPARPTTIEKLQELDPDIATWVAKQRKHYKKKKLSKVQKRRLREIGLSLTGDTLFASDIPDETSQAAAAAEAVVTAVIPATGEVSCHDENHSIVRDPEDEEIPTKKQRSLSLPRRKRKRGSAIDQAIKMVEASKWIKEGWKESFNLLISYLEQNGLQQIPSRMAGAERVSKWLQNQKAYYRSCTREWQMMPPQRERHDILESLGFVWDNEDVDGQDSNGCNDDTLLQGSLKGKGKQTEKKLTHAPPAKKRRKNVSNIEKAVAKVESSKLLKAYWKKMFKLLIVYLKKNGLQQIPYPLVGADRLVNQWLHNERANYKGYGIKHEKTERRILLDRERYDVLDTLGFVWNGNINVENDDDSNNEGNAAIRGGHQNDREGENRSATISNSGRNGTKDHLAIVELSDESGREDRDVHRDGPMNKSIPNCSLGSERNRQSWKKMFREDYEDIWKDIPTSPTEGNEICICNPEDATVTTPSWALIPEAWMLMYNRLVDYMDERKLRWLTDDLQGADSNLVEWFHNQRRGYALALRQKNPMFTKSYRAQISLLNSIGFPWGNQLNHRAPN